MVVVQARFLDGSSMLLTKCENVGQIMIHVANVHRRFAPDVAVTCPDTGRDLTNPPSQIPPSIVQVAVKTEKKTHSDEDLLLSLRLHGQYEDAATCVRAFEMLKKRHDGDAFDHILLLGVFGKPLSGTIDIEIQKKIVRTLVRVGANLNYFLYNAAEHQDESMVKMLLSTGVPVEGAAVEYDKSHLCTRAQPLSIAAKRGHVGMVKLLLAHKADANCVAELPYGAFIEYGTPLLFAADSKHADVARALLEHKALVNFALPFASAEKTPLYMALRSGSEELVELLLTNRANPVDKEGFSFLKQACESGNANILKMLVDHGGSFHQNHIDSFLAATSSGAVVHTLLDLHMRDILDSPLLNACTYGMLEVANELFGCKADINGAHPAGPTPLHAACHSDQLDMVTTLLARKANVHKVLSTGTTALDLALDANNITLADLLQKHGACLPGESSIAVLAEKRQRESEDCSASSARKRQQLTEDETSGKRTCSSGNDAIEEKENQNHFFAIEDNSNNQITSDGCCSYAPTSKDGNTLDEE